MRHQIDLADLSAHTFTHPLASSVGNGRSKRLVAVVFPSVGGPGALVHYEVWAQGEQRLTTFFLTEAVEAYNDLP